MTGSFSLIDSRSLGDLQVFLNRAGRVEDGSVRLIAGSGVLAAYVAVFYPIGLADDTPTILGLRTFALTSSDTFDVVVPQRSLMQRLARLEYEMTDVSAPVTVSLPIEVNTVTWAAISPPRGGWVALDGVDTAVLESVAKAGIAEIAAGVPQEVAGTVLRNVRAEVWGRPIDGFEHIVSGGAFAALSLGFLGAEAQVSVYESGPWTRLTTRHGHVLIKRKAWTLHR